MIFSIVVALAIYAAAAAGSVALARRFAGPVSTRAAWLLACLPLAFTGRALLSAKLYGPADLYAPYPPWRAAAPAEMVTNPANPILSDLAFANIPWRAAVRDSVANGRFPFWNRFVLAGNPLLASAQAGVFHPATFLGILLPLALSWDFSCTFTIFLALLAGFLCFRSFGVDETSGLLGAAAWALSTYMLFWTGWSVGPSTATFPLLVLGFRRIARREAHGIALTVAALLLGLAGGHPESFFHTTTAGGVIFLADLVVLALRSRPATPSLLRPLLGATGAGVLALLLAGPQLFPLLAAIPRSAEYRERSSRRTAGERSQSVPAAEAARRLLPAVLPFAHGIYGRSPVQGERGDGSGMPLAYAGAVLFPFALLGLRRRAPGGATFAALAAAGLLLGASAPGLIDVLTRMPGFALALNYRLVFLAPFGLAGLAALGFEECRSTGGLRRLAIAALASAAAIGAAAALARPLYSERGLPASFVGSALSAEVLPLVLLAAAAWAATASARPELRAAVASSGLLLLLVQRGAEMGGVYPTLDGSLLTPAAAPLDIARRSTVSDGSRVVGAGSDLRPNGSALLGLEDVRGYESIVLDRFADTYPLWCSRQAASFNRVDDLTRPFLAFLGARFAVAAPGEEPPAGWMVRARSAEMALFENPRALPRAFVPSRIESVPDPLSAFGAASDFSRTVWVAGSPAVSENGTAHVSMRTAGPDLLLDVDAAAPTLIATSLPDWPGWHAEGDAQDGVAAPTLETVNHAFVGLRVLAGRSRVRLSYRPPGFGLGVAAFGAGCAILLADRVRRRRSRSLTADR